MNEYKHGVVEALLYSIQVLTNMDQDKALEKLKDTLINVNISIVEDFTHKWRGRING